METLYNALCDGAALNPDPNESDAGDFICRQEDGQDEIEHHNVMVDHFDAVFHGPEDGDAMENDFDEYVSLTWALQYVVCFMVLKMGTQWKMISTSM